MSIVVSLKAITLVTKRYIHSQLDRVLKRTVRQWCELLAGHVWGSPGSALERKPRRVLVGSLNLLAESNLSYFSNTQATAGVF